MPTPSIASKTEKSGIVVPYITVWEIEGYPKTAIPYQYLIQQEGWLPSCEG
jgi:hypothetical protein